MQSTAFPLLLTLAAVPAFGADIIGGAAFDDLRVGVGLSEVDGRDHQDSNRDVKLTRFGASLTSLSGYPAPDPQSAVGWTIGAKASLQGWADHDDQTDYTATAPTLSLLGGGYVDINRKARFELTPEFGAGMAWSSYRRRSNESERTSAGRPFVHYGIHFSAMFHASDSFGLGLDLGWERDHLPYVTADGWTIGLLVSIK